MKKLLLFLVALFLWAGSSWAQVSTYAFASSAGSYTAITGGTLLKSGTSAMDSWASTAQTIPSFTFNSIAYTTAYVTSNGILTLGGSAPSMYSTTGISSTVGSGIAICPFSADLDRATTTVSTEIRWETIGNEVIFQWQQMKRYSATESFDMQVRLNTSTGVVSIVYKLNSGPGTITSYQPQVGIRTSLTDYNNRLVASGAEDWATSLVGVSNASTCRFTSAVPAKGFTTGLTYTFTPPVIVTPPNCATIVSPADVATGIAATATLNWASGGGGPTGYKLYYGTDNPPTNIVNGTDLGNVTTYNPTPDMSYSTTYYWKVVAYNANGDATGCPVWSFTTMADPSISTFPYSQSFDGATFAPTGWTNVKTAGSGTPGVWDRQTTGTNPTCSMHSGAAMARYNCYNLSDGTKGELTTPPITFPNDDHRVKFWFYRDASAYPTNADLVNVYYNTTNSSSGATLLGTINRSTTLAPIVDAQGWYEYSYNMPAGSTGSGRYIIFEAVSGYGNNLFLDDITIEAIPAIPIFSISPSSKAFGNLVSGTTSSGQTFTISNTGGGTLTITTGNISLTGTDPGQFTLTDGNTYPINLTAGQTATVSVAFAPTTAGSKTANLQVVHNAAGSPSTSALSGTSLPVGSLFESFEGATFPPAGWSVDASTWTSSSSAYDGTKSTYYTYYGAVTDKKLMTPKVTIASGNTLTFYAKNSSGSDQKLQIKSSPDKTTWSNIGTEIILTSTYTQYSIDLSSLAGGNYYLAFSANSTYIYTNYFYVDYVSGPVIFQEAPGPATIGAPANAATNISINTTVSWTAGATGGIPTGYYLYFGTDGGGVTSPTNIENGTTKTSPYTPAAPLAYSTTYYWQVVPFNTIGNATDCPIWSFTTIADPTLIPPFTQAFGTYPPTNWEEKVGLLAAPSSLTGTTSAWAADGFANGGATGAAGINIYGTTRKEWMITPPINLGDGSLDYRLTFDLALTAYGATGAADMDGVDDKFVVVISTDNGVTWTSANSLKLWDNAGSPNVYNDIATSGENILIDLSSYTGIIKLGFYGESTVSNADNDLFVDNVTIEEIPSAPIFSISPSSKVYGTINIGSASSQVFTISNTGAGTLTIDPAISITGTDPTQFILTDANVYPLNLTAGQSATVSVDFTPTTAGPKTANLTVIDNLAKSTHNVPLSGTGYDATISTFPWQEGFEGTWPTIGWTNTTWEQSTYGTPHTGTEFAYSNISGSSLITPPIAIPASGNYEFSYWYRAEDLGYPQNMDVLLSTDGINYTTTISSHLGITNATYIKVTYSLNSFLGQTINIKFVGLTGTGGYDYGILVDDVQVANLNTTWLGTTSTDWTVAGNWSADVPASYSNVTIGASSNNPLLATAVTVNNLTINASAVLNISPSGQLSVTTSLTNNGGTTGLVLKSDGGGTGSLLHNSDNVNATVERYVTGSPVLTNLHYHNVAIPMNADMTAAVFTGMYAFSFDAAAQDWSIVGPSTSDPVYKDRGYMIYSPLSSTTISFAGQMNNGNFTTSTPSGASSFVDPNYVGGYNLVPNPYPSSLDWDVASGFTTTNLRTTIWLFNASSGNYGAYVRGASGGTGTNGATRTIPVGQAFFVQATTAGAPALTITNAARKHGNTNILKQTESVKDMLRMKSYNDSYSDELIVKFDRESSNAFDDNLDAQKLRGAAEASQIYSLTPEGTELSINNVPYSTQTITIPVGFELGNNSEATLSFTGLESFESSVSIFLEDKLLNKTIDLHENPVYNFTNSTGADPMRFNLLFYGVNSSNELNTSNFNIWVNNNKINILIPDMIGQKAVVELIDLQGRVLSAQAITLDSSSVIDAPVSSGFYIVRVVSGKQAFTTKVFIR